MDETAGDEGLPFLLNDLGDIYGRRFPDGSVEQVDLDEWGWAAATHQVGEENRATIGQVRALPGFEVTVREIHPEGHARPRSEAGSITPTHDGTVPPPSLFCRPNQLASGRPRSVGWERRKRRDAGGTESVRRREALERQQARQATAQPRDLTNRRRLSLAGA